MTNSGGGLDGFEAFCREVETPLYTYVLRLVRNENDAEDIAQEALVRVLCLAKEGRLRRGNGTERALLFTLAHNLAVDHHRTRRWVAPSRDRPEPPPDRPLAQVLARQQLDMALDELPEPHRHALLLRVFGELPYSDIAHALSATEGQVKTWVYRARKRLAQLLDSDGQYIGGRGGEPSNGD